MHSPSSQDCRRSYAPIRIERVSSSASRNPLLLVRRHDERAVDPPRRQKDAPMLDTITIRQMPFEFPDEIDPVLLDGDHDRSFSFIAGSLLLPHLEP
jgi:hypothetical protein